ncbi:hypothetical protein Tco_0553975 [Tanacetum coccineum]
MSRIISQTLISKSSSSNSTQFQSIKRLYSNQSSPKPQIIEIDLNESDEVLGIRKLEDAIHSIIVKQSAPDWLPFSPGSSYWVPPRHHHHIHHHPSNIGLFGLLNKFGNVSSDDDGSSLGGKVGKAKGSWPSVSFFVEDTSFTRPVTREMEAEVVHSSEEINSDAKNEEE